MLKKQQILVVGGIVILMAVLLSLNIKGLVKPAEEQAAVSNEPITTTTTYTVEQASENARLDLNANIAQQIKDLEEQFKTSSANEKLEIQRKLAQSWDDVNKPAPAAFYYEMIAEQESKFDNWLVAGDRFTDAYQNTQDSLVQPALMQKATHAYQQAVALDKSNLDAQTGLGVAYVNGSANPMQGITLLLGVVKEDPKNIKANMNLGLFSMKSGQFDKAVDRFKTVVAQKPDPEAWFYLASSYENQGLIDEAITAYLKTKELAADPSLSQFVDRKIKELKK